MTYDDEKRERNSDIEKELDKFGYFSTSQQIHVGLKNNPVLDPSVPQM